MTEMTWQPIETAPRDSWELYRRRALGGWMHKSLGLVWGKLEWRTHGRVGEFIASGGTPTHWMELPELPK